MDVVNHGGIERRDRGERGEGARVGGKVERYEHPFEVRKRRRSSGAVARRLAPPPATDGQPFGLKTVESARGGAGRRGPFVGTLVSLLMLLIGAEPAGARQERTAPLKVCATVPDLGDIARQVGGERVSVTVFVKGTEDPHFLEAKPSFIKAAAEADALIQVGMELEMGWLPPILANCRNDKLQPGQPGSIDVSTVIAPLELASGPVDRSMGDVHAAGNPHYL